MAMKKDGTMINGGRPKKEIDKKSFENLCNLQCTKEEICGFLDIDEKTLTRWCKETYGEGFSEVYKKVASGGKISLRRKQFSKAVNEGNTTMLIWLGKQYLGQSDKMENTRDASDQVADAIRGLINNETD